MEIFSINDFFSQTMGGRPNQMDVSIYRDINLQCACGKEHPFSGESSDVIRELTGRRLVIECPEGGAMTCIKVKGLFKYKLQSLFGTFGEEE